MNISLIIPCYKDSATLSFALDSAINQTYPLHEIKAKDRVAESL